MPPFDSIGQIIGWVGLLATAFAALVGGLRALFRGPREDRVAEAEIQERVTAMAERWLARAEVRLEEAESDVQQVKAEAEQAKVKADAAKVETAELRSRVTELEHNLHSALDAVDVLWPWGMAGGPASGKPAPQLAQWIMDRLHNLYPGAQSQ